MAAMMHKMTIVGDSIAVLVVQNASFPVILATASAIT